MKNSLKVLSLLLIIFILPACLTLRGLDKAKKNYNDGKYSAVTKIEIDCKKKDAGCNQLYLLKGNACYKLAKEGKGNTKGFYFCASANLETGINMTTSWEGNDRAQNYTNLSDSLKELQDLNSGEAASNATEKLYAAATQSPPDTCHS